MRIGNVVSSSNDDGIQFVKELNCCYCPFAMEKSVVIIITLLDPIDKMVATYFTINT